MARNDSPDPDRNVAVNSATDPQRPGSPSRPPAAKDSYPPGTRRRRRRYRRTPRPPPTSPVPRRARRIGATTPAAAASSSSQKEARHDAAARPAHGITLHLPSHRRDRPAADVGVRRRLRAAPPRRPRPRCRHPRPRGRARGQLQPAGGLRHRRLLHDDGGNIVATVDYTFATSPDHRVDRPRPVHLRAFRGQCTYAATSFTESGSKERHRHRRGRGTYTLIVATSVRSTRRSPSRSSTPRARAPAWAAAVDALAPADRGR